MAQTCPMCGGPPNSCQCIQKLWNYLHPPKKGGVYSASGIAAQQQPAPTSNNSMLPEHSLSVKEWLKKLEQFVDLPTEYSEEFEKRSEIQIYLVAIHELDNISLYQFLEWIYYEIHEKKHIFGGWIGGITRSPTRLITVLDAFVIREYCNRYLIQNKVRIEREELAKIAYNNFHQALAYQQSFIDDNFFPDEFDKGPDMSMQHNQRIAAQIQIVEGLVKRNQLGSKEGKRQIKELEKQYR